MTFCEGGDLASAIRAQRASGAHFPEAQVLNWFAQLALALGHTHERRILHRDLKTQNVFLTKGHLIKLGDYGKRGGGSAGVRAEPAAAAPGRHAEPAAAAPGCARQRLQARPGGRAFARARGSADAAPLRGREAKPQTHRALHPPACPRSSPPVTGIARLLDGSHEQAQTVVGTPFYMSPEVCQVRPLPSSCSAAPLLPACAHQHELLTPQPSP